MKIRLAVLNGKRTAQLCATLLVGIGLSLGVTSAQAQDAKPSPPVKASPTPKPPKPTPTPKPPKPTPTPKPPKPTPTPKPGKCVVCDHAGGKPKEKQIPCDQVDKYLADHPDATRGPCVPTPVTNP